MHNQKLNILVVDDEPAVRASLRAGLEEHGWSVREASDRASMMRIIDLDRIDLVTLDLILEREDGLDLARELRAKKNIPILVITGRGDPFDRVIGLEHGADDYIVKPFHMREVILRIERLMQRYNSNILENQTVTFDTSAYDVKRKVVRQLDGSAVHLTEMELKILELFLRHPGRVLSRDEIYQSLHGRDWSPLDRTIDGHVARLRRKIEPAGDAPVLIRSVRGVGYVFTAEVSPD
ncbi:response regulator transcription factor [Thalassovita sp.]|uniref:response regulator transcription factor n=1 Tax=Thalassovita sp. TaxID=1979401 RepID=UPI0029DE61C0|nr:response regulator transcription factor [Thalassovita sp.]